MNIAARVATEHPESWVLTGEGLLAAFALILVAAIGAWTLTQWVPREPDEDTGPVEGQCAVTGCTAKATQPWMRDDGTLIVVCARCDDEMADPRIQC